MELIIWFLFSALPSVRAISVFRTNNTEFGSGLKLNSSSVEKSNFTQGISICGRFNYNRLGAAGKSTQIFQIETPGAFMWSFMGYQETFMQFGYFNWVVKEVPKNNFRLWSTNQWHQICWSYDRQTSFLMFVKV